MRGSIFYPLIRMISLFIFVLFLGFFVLGVLAVHARGEVKSFGMRYDGRFQFKDSVKFKLFYYSDRLYQNLTNPGLPQKKRVGFVNGVMGALAKNVNRWHFLNQHEIEDYFFTNLNFEELLEFLRGELTHGSGNQIWSEEDISSLLEYNDNYASNLYFRLFRLKFSGASDLRGVEFYLFVFNAYTDESIRVRVFSWDG